MANAADETAVMIENLRDMGLSDDMIGKCLKFVEQKRYQELEKFLRTYRKTLLDNIHRYNDCIGCLDYFTYTLRKNGGI